MKLNADTKLKDILNEYPWLKVELPKMDSRLKIMNTPVGKMLIKKSTIKDVSSKTGYSVEKLISKLEGIIENHT